MSSFQLAEYSDDEYVADELQIRDQNKDILLFIIDCSVGMLQKTGDANSESALRLALSTALTLFKSKALASNNDEVGLLFYGTVRFSLYLGN